MRRAMPIQFPASSNLDAEGLPVISRRQSYVAVSLVSLLLLAFGGVRVPLETRLTQQEQVAGFRDKNLNLGLRAKIGQLSFLAALSGFRTLVADLLFLKAQTAWERVEYGTMHFLFDTVTTLAPHNINFWDMSAWHMAYNASVAVMNDPKNKKIAYRVKLQHEYFLLGKDYLERGIANNPDSYLLHQNLANIYRDKLKDPYQASLEYDKAAASPGAPTYEKRFAAYELSQSSGHEREAWQRLRKLYDMGDQERLPTLEKDLKAMEEALNLPEDQRIYKTPIFNPLDVIADKLHVPMEQRVYKAP